MRRLGLTARIFLALLVGGIPPILALVVTLAGVPEGLRLTDAPLVAGAIILASLAWIAIVAVTYGRVLREEIATLVRLGERGRHSEREAGAATESDALYNRLASSLEERNRQVAELAAQVRRAPIGDEPHRVAEHVVRSVRSVIRDPTWSLVVLESGMPELLPAGVYEGDPRGPDEPRPQVTDLHRWASVAAAENAEPREAVHVEGPWGAFVVLAIASDDQLRAIMLAPWEGRAAPSTAERALLSLVAEHAATAVEHALLYARVRVQGEAIDRMAEVQRDFLRAVTHDLQTPLTSIRAVAAELRAALPGLDQQGAADLDLIEHQADRLRRMVAQLLVVARLEAGPIEPRVEVVNPRPIVERTWKALRASGRRLDLSVEGPPMLVIADPDRLEQVLWAVLDNAVKYSPAATPIGVRISSSDHRARISITDGGPGMDPATTNRAFEQFFRAEAARRLAPDGSGIGLYAARGLVEAMEGSVSIESALGHGTTIHVELPAEPADD
jgi:signal transduction histidine kinase